MNRKVQIRYTKRSIDSIIAILQKCKYDKSFDKAWSYDASKEKFIYTCIADDDSWNIFVCSPSGMLSENEFAHEMYINIKNGKVYMYNSMAIKEIP